MRPHWSRHGQEASRFEAVYHANVGMVARERYQIVRDHGLAEEITQDVFCGFGSAPAMTPRVARLAPICAGCSRAAARSISGRRGRTSDNVIEALKGHAAITSNAAEMPADVLVGGVERMCTRSAVKRLPIDQRTAIALLYWGDLTCGQAAEREEIPLGTAKSRVRLGLAKLAQDPALLL